MRRLLITDMDYTLLNERAQVSGENLAAIRAHVARGGLFTVATGRAAEAARIFPELMELINLPAITGNGGQVCDLKTGKLLYERTLPEGMEFVANHLMEAFPQAGVVVYHGYNGFYRFQNNDYIDELVEREGRPVTDTTVEASPKPWNKLLFSRDHSYLLNVRQSAEPLIKGLARTVFSEQNFLELLPLGVSKGAALKFLMDLEGLKAVDIVAVGDALNDLEMIQVAGMGVAVGNAHPDLKAAADAVVCKNTEHAVRECVERFLT